MEIETEEILYEGEKFKKKLINVIKNWIFKNLTKCLINFCYRMVKI